MPKFSFVLTVEVEVETDTEAEAMAYLVESFPYSDRGRAPALVKQGGEWVEGRVIEAFTFSEWEKVIG